MKNFVLRAVWLASCVLLVAARLSAQDVIVNNPVWLDPVKPPGDTPPTFKKPLKVSYPIKEAGAEGQGYVLTVFYLGADGGLRHYGSNASEENEVWLNALWATFTNVSKGFEPARKSGSPIAAFAYFTVIFNPKSADVSAADALPRILEVSPVFLPDKLLGVLGRPHGFPVRVAVGADGTLSLLEILHMELKNSEAAVGAALARWRISPQRKGGIAIASEMRIWLVACGEPSDKNQLPPAVVKRVEPKYPMALKQAGQTGEVLVSFIVDTQGAVRDVVVERSNHPGFENAATECVRKWRFKPGMKDGRVVNTRMMQPIVFQLDGVSNSGGVVTLSKALHNEQEKLPEELRYDVAPKAKGVIFPAYPYDLYMDGKGGIVEAAVIINTRGFVTQVKVLTASYPEQGEALAAALACCEFVPAMRADVPVATMFKFNYNFKAGESGSYPAREWMRIAEIVRKTPEKIVSPKSLDKPLVPISQRKPIFPSTESVDKGEAMIEILIDEEGRVCLPKVISATAPIFGYAAAQAISDWRFEVPKVKGKAVIVRVRVPVKFAQVVVGPGAR